MIENNPVLSAASGFWDARLWPRQGVAVTHSKRPLASKRQHPSDNPLLVWITLWATWLRDAPSHENAGPATDCSKLKQEEVVENQALARI
jgi:hypothetical protein